jgi:hypothetical protein
MITEARGLINGLRQNVFAHMAAVVKKPTFVQQADLSAVLVAVSPL